MKKEKKNTRRITDCKKKFITLKVFIGFPIHQWERFCFARRLLKKLPSFMMELLVVPERHWRLPCQIQHQESSRQHYQPSLAM
ncbi:MAG: hypothetical protein ACRDCT_32385 [Shewanella sp.]